MKRYFLHSKLHHGCITASQLDYEGSFGIDANLMQLANIKPYEQVQVYNITTGSRFTTYAIEESGGSQALIPKGACAHLAQPGERVIICTYCEVEVGELSSHQPQVIMLDAHNDVKQTTR